MSIPEFSKKGQELIEMYGTMARDGYDRVDQPSVKNVYNEFELRPYRGHILSVFEEHLISTVLDYGCGGSDWTTPDFDKESGQSATDYFKLQQAYRYEPARDLDERQPVDCVVSFDVLEHVFIADVPAVLRDMFSYASKLLVLNVACYPASAKLPNGENAHITVREPSWWKGMVDSIAVEFPQVSVFLLCSTKWRTSSGFPIYSAGGWQESPTFVVAN